MANIFKLFSNGSVLGTDNNDSITVMFGSATIEGRLGNDVIRSVFGNASIFGDFMSDVSLTLSVPDNTIVRTDPVTKDYGNDWIYGGFGSNLLVGDVGNLNIDISSGEGSTSDSLAYLIDATLNMGTDHIYGGFGNDIIVGDVKMLDMSAAAGEASGDAPNIDPNWPANYPDLYSGVLTRAVGGHLFFNGGNDYLYGGLGNDEIYGDILNLQATMKFGAATGEGSSTSSAFSGTAILGPADANVRSTFTMGDDILQGDFGNDKLVGDIGNFAIMSTVDANSGATAAGAVSSALFANSIYQMGNDDLDGGFGNDKLYGDIENFSIFFQPPPSIADGTTPSYSGQEIQGAEGVSSFNQFYMGDDTLSGGVGMDILVGDIGQIDILLKSNENAGDTDNVAFNAAQQRNDLFTFGSDHLSGGANDDSLYGDVKDLKTVLVSNSSNAQAISFSGWAGSSETIANDNTYITGEDWLYGDSGNDKLFGDFGTFVLQATGGTVVEDYNYNTA